MAIWQKLFRWRSRVKVGAPDVAGDIETLTAHVADPNAHADYLKKGQAVPTGQEQAMIAAHRADPQAHAKTSVRRAELLKTLEQYKAAKDSELADTVNNYTKTNPPPTRHVVTAYVLAQVLAAFKLSHMRLSVHRLVLCTSVTVLSLLWRMTLFSLEAIRRSMV